MHVAPALGPLLATHPALRLRLEVDDALIDLIGERIDLAIRFGPLADSSWVAQRLGRMQWWLCAAPSWVARHGLPTHPDALLTQGWLAFDRGQSALLLEVRSPRDETRTLRITSNNQLSIQQMCEDGLGPGLQGSMDVHGAIEDGRLRRLLPDWEFGAMDIWAVTPQRDAQPAKVRLAIAALGQYLRGLPGVRY